MKKFNSLLFSSLLFSGLVSCSLEPEPIKYGEDTCHFCEMTIVSKAHSAQGVSAKGKQFKYDAIECMVHDIIKNDRAMALKQVADFSQPGTMMEVDRAHFVIHDTINSPMGENLAALRKETQEQEDLLSWDELKARFLSKNKVTTNH